MCNFIELPGTTTPCALKIFKNSVALEKDPEQVNFIKMRIHGIWDCPDQDQGDLVDLEDVSESKHTQETTDHTDEVNGDNPNQRVSREEPRLPDLLLD